VPAAAHGPIWILACACACLLAACASPASVEPGSDAFAVDAQRLAGLTAFVRATDVSARAALAAHDAQALHAARIEFERGATLRLAGEARVELENAIRAAVAVVRSADELDDSARALLVELDALVAASRPVYVDIELPADAAELRREATELDVLRARLVAPFERARGG
jgi:hypothetical protein